jgi:hypothetical protein
MLKANRKLRKPIWLNFAVLALLQVSSGFMLSACQKPVIRTKSSTEQPKEKQSPKSEQSEPKKADEKQKENQPTTKQDKSNQSTKSKQQEDNKKDSGEDTQDDDAQE